MFKNMISILVVAGLVLVLAPSAHADIISFQEGVSPTGAYTHDATYIRSGSPTDNFDLDEDLELIAGPTVTDVLRTLLEFDVSTIPASNQIDSASLVLTTCSNGTGGIGGTETFNVHAYNYDIVETVSTWDDPDGDGNDATGDTTAGGTLGTLLTSASFLVTQKGLAVTFGDSSAFRTAVSDALAGDGFLRLILANNDETVNSTHNFARFAADSFGTTGDRPELVVEHTPEPATMSLLALGGLAILRRRRRARA
ncbi:MAG: DNRLRE domain-containing protein [Phycisphaerae bacterium]|nr:DNRLRE domain-containing protein [Phycisphaerae bacterium]